jgi:hypothetical protein
MKSGERYLIHISDLVTEYYLLLEVVEAVEVTNQLDITSL